ncbi:PIG-L family deacetylase [Flavobacteriaceae bacterium]|nr:PIG-L family deacetylase [Flavobacteriaceae bacterium]
MNKKILVLAAHPDDETLGCGGTLHRLSKEGYDVNLLTFTDGESSRGIQGLNRNEKLNNVASILGISNYNSGKFPDNAMDSVPLIEICKFIEENVNYIPDIIFTHHYEDLNIDHHLVAKATFTVFRPQKGNSHVIYSYFVPSSSDYNPISNFTGKTYFKLNENDVEAKHSALSIYDKEMREYPHSRSYKNIKNLIKVWGSEVGTEYAEKFILIRELI